jgi:hypothetical protein
MKSASNVKGIDTIAVVIINVRIDVGSIGAPKKGRKGIGNMNKSQMPARTTRTFHLFFSILRIILLPSSSLYFGDGEKWDFWYGSLRSSGSNNISPTQ